MPTSNHSHQEPSARDLNLLAAVIKQTPNSTATTNTNQIGGLCRSFTGNCGLFPPEHPIGDQYVFRFRHRSGREFLQPTA